MGVGIEKSWMWMKYIETISNLTTITYKNTTYEATHIKRPSGKRKRWQLSIKKKVCPIVK